MRTARWHATIRDARVEIEDLLEDSPSLRREIPDMIAGQAGNAAAKLAAADLDQVLGDGFLGPPG